MVLVRVELYTCRNSNREQNLIVEFFSTVPGKNLDMFIISTRTKTI